MKTIILLGFILIASAFAAPLQNLSGIFSSVSYYIIVVLSSFNTASHSFIILRRKIDFPFNLFSQTLQKLSKSFARAKSFSPTKQQKKLQLSLNFYVTHQAGSNRTNFALPLPLFIAEKLSSADGEKTKEKVPNDEAHIVEPKGDSIAEVCDLIYFWMFIYWFCKRCGASGQTTEQCHNNMSQGTLCITCRAFPYFAFWPEALSQINEALKQHEKGFFNCSWRQWGVASSVLKELSPAANQHIPTIKLFDYISSILPSFWKPASFITTLHPSPTLTRAVSDSRNAW